MFSYFSPSKRASKTCRHFLIFKPRSSRGPEVSLKPRTGSGCPASRGSPAPAPRALGWDLALGGAMDLWLWAIYFLPVAGALRRLPEVKLEGTLGGSVTIECPLPRMPGRLYLCREVDESRSCVTVISSKNFVRNEYRNRVALTLCPDQNQFLVEVNELTEGDSGVYACGAGSNTDRGKTQQVTLDVHSGEYEPLWEEEEVPEPPAWFQKFLPPWFEMPAHASSSEFPSKVSMSTLRTEVLPARHPSPTTPIIRHPRVSRSPSVELAKPTSLPPSTTASKTSAPEERLRLQAASYNHANHPTRLHRQRDFSQVPVSRLQDQGFHILIPTVLGLILLAVLGLVVKRVIQRRRALSRRVRRLAVRMSALEASLSQRPRVSPRPRSQNNIYSACPRRARRAPTAGEGEAPVPGPGASAPPAPPQVSEVPWPHATSLKAGCDSMSFHHKPAAEVEDTDSDDYVNISCQAHLSSCPPGPRPWCQ